MKRRVFNQSFLPFAASAACAIGSARVQAASLRVFNQKEHYRWGVLYWMPYDNDLSRFGDDIVEMLASSLKSEDIVVGVQSDYLEHTGMRRLRLNSKSAEELEIKSEDSSSESALRDYLGWANANLSAEHWIVIIVGHGGQLNEISPDDYQPTRSGRTWMSVEQFASAVSDFNRSTGDCVELLFFQNCNKATIEATYEARNCARYTLASQLLLGAPNYYYEGFLERLPRLKLGSEAALAIIENEEKDMYHTLTLINNERIREVPEHLVVLLEESESQLISKPNLVSYGYFGESYYDFASFIAEAFSSGENQNQAAERLIRFIKSDVIAHYQTDGKLYQFSAPALSLDQLSGLGIYLPNSHEDIDRYQSLALYRDCNLQALYQELLAS